MRIVSGSTQNIHVDRKWMQEALKSQGPDGLIYTPSRPATATGISMSCTDWCTRTMYWVWQHMLRPRDRTLRVNLVLNRASPRADIAS